MNKKGVSAIIGVILMVAITVAICAIVYVYVSGMLGYDENKIIISGNITEKHILNSGLGSRLYIFTLNNNSDVEVTENEYYKYLVGDYYIKI